ncbi:HEAT repeat [Pedococcus dokdonensis]|uniref:HEAT repeat n=1 Tax=Pedococcus dokdonensis TaxID=443156 RepID=A0A1H0LD61_9MICO|nr:HEAT repeat domain-containing protein [Pedococcus dokdonensis]SDO65931.1 HEAT repeat [Pedococcus dokdonensis]
MSARGILWASSALVLLTCVALVLVIVSTKVTRTLRDRRTHALVAPHRPALLAVASGEDDDGSARDALIAVDGPARDALDDVVVELLEKVRGAPAEELAAVLLAHGAVDRAPHDLVHRSTIRRARAAHVLGLCRVGAALPLVVEALKDPAPEVRVAATRALGRLGQPSAAPPLLAAVGADRVVPAGPAADALEGMGVGIADALRDGLLAVSPTTRTVAAYLSGEGSFTRSIDVLRLSLATDEDTTVRAAAAVALGRMGRPADVAVLLQGTDPDEPSSLRRACAEALADLGDPGAVEGLQGLLADPDPRLAEIAATSLLRLGPVGRAALDQAPANASTETARALARLQGHPA